MTLRHYDALLSSSVQGPPGPSGTSEESSGDVEDVAEMAAKLVVRDESADAAFRQVAAVELVEVGTTSSGKAALAPTYVEVGSGDKARFQATTPTVEGQLQVDPATGIPSVFVDGAAREVALDRDLMPYTFTIPEDATALAATPEHPVWDGLPYDVEITGGWIRPGDMIAAHASDIAVVTIRARNNSGVEVGGVVADTSTSGLGDVDPFERGVFDVTPFTVPADGMVTIEITKEGAGTQLPAIAITLAWQRA